MPSYVVAATAWHDLSVEDQPAVIEVLSAVGFEFKGEPSPR